MKTQTSAGSTANATVGTTVGATVGATEVATPPSSITTGSSPPTAFASPRARATWQRRPAQPARLATPRWERREPRLFRLEMPRWRYAAV
jgi:hypothetical protein